MATDAPQAPAGRLEAAGGGVSAGGGSNVTGMTFLSCMVPEDLKQRLQKIADAEDRKLSYLVRQAIGEFVEAHEKNGKAA